MSYKADGRGVTKNLGNVVAYEKWLQDFGDSEMVELQVSKGKVYVFSDSPGCTCINGNDIYDLGYRAKDTRDGVKIQIGEVELVIEKPPKLEGKNLDEYVLITVRRLTKDGPIQFQDLYDAIQGRVALQTGDISQSIWRLNRNNKLSIDKDLGICPT